MASASLFEWRDVLFQYLGFVSSFWMLGAVGFRYGVVREPPGDGGLSGAFDKASARAAAFGWVGVWLASVSITASLEKRAEAKHLTLGQVASASGPALALQVVLLAILLVAFPLARRRVALGWSVAAGCVLAYALRGIVGGRLNAMVNPLHVLGASLWLGTLFILVVCGIGEMLRPTVPAAERESAVAEMVHRFSVLALCSAGLLGVTGVITAWTHLKHLDALWTTPYGLALVRKLVFVLAVLLLGAWNWRRVGPSLGSDGGALKIRRSASSELAFAAVVLLFTAILVSTPSPK